jgi:lysine 6-dehydrogenase
MISDTVVLNIIILQGKKETMRVLVLGGGGAMGAMAARFIAQTPGVPMVTVADRRLANATTTAEGLAGSLARVLALELDVDDHAKLAETIAVHDLVVNAVGPFYRFGVPILKAVIAAGRHYVDICDDWEPTIDMLALHDDAQATGSICIVGAGASPGASNLLAVLAARELDEVDDVFTVWPVDVGPDGDKDLSVVPGVDGPSAAVVHWMQQISGSIRVLSNGRFVDVAPLEPIAMTFPGYGSGTVYTVGHPEPITLAASLRVRGQAANAMLVTPPTLAFLDELRRDIDNGKLTNETAAAALESPSIRRQAKAAVGSLRKDGPGKLPFFFALATGTKAGVATRSGATVSAFPSDMATATAAPAAIAVQQLVNGTISTPGVHPPERVIDPTAFFVSLHSYCHGAVAGVPIAEVTSEVISP